MEDSFNSPSPCIQARAVQNLLAACLSAEKLDVNLPPYRSLWAGCRHTASYVSKQCTAAILSLVKSGKVAFEGAVEGFLDIIPAAKFTHLESFVIAVFDLILMHIEYQAAKGSSYVCPYSSRSHPLISILTHRGEAGSSILALFYRQLQQSTSHLNELLQVALPLAEFSFLSTRGFAERSMFRAEFFTFLLEFGKRVGCLDSIHEALGRACSSAPLDDSESASQVLLLSKKLVDSVFQSKQMSPSLLHSILSVCELCIEFGTACDQALDLVSFYCNYFTPSNLFFFRHLSLSFTRGMLASIPTQQLFSRHICCSTP